MDREKFYRLLRLGIEKGASDIHFQVGNLPLYRFNGNLVELRYKVLEPADTEEIARLLLEGDECEGTEFNELDLAYEETFTTDLQTSPTLAFALQSMTSAAQQALAAAQAANARGARQASAQPVAPSSRMTETLARALVPPSFSRRTYCGRRKVPWVSSPHRSPSTMQPATVRASTSGTSQATRALDKKSRTRLAGTRIRDGGVSSSTALGLDA